ncbi:MAG: hypothetical protein ACXWM6_07945 [Thermodesulfobacteriota bacterium]
MKLRETLLIPLIFFLLLQPCFALTDEEIQKSQTFLIGKPIGEKMVFWAEKFIGVPYDRDPLGEYVSKAKIVADERVDCMYLTFRVAELALSRTPEEAIQVALEKRFHSKGVLKNGQVVNYEDRFEYGEDMIESGKWGEEVTPEIGKITRIKGSRGKDVVDVLSPGVLLMGLRNLKNGDIIFFATRPEKRKVGEIIGHMGFIKVEERTNRSGSKDVFLIHAGGTKQKGGEVRKILLKDYLSKMGFIGVKITRFQ